MTYVSLEFHLPNGKPPRNYTFDFEIHCHGHEHLYASKCEGVRHCMQDYTLTDCSLNRGDREREYAFELDFHAEVVPEVRSSNPLAGLI